MGRRFVAERRRDPYYRAAQLEGLRSRAAFKIAFLMERFPIARPGDIILDLGAAPGGWSVVLAERVGRRGRVVAIDPRPIDPIPGVDVLHARVGDPTLGDRLGGRRFRSVVSDMSPSISGAYGTDHARSVDLVRSAFGLARSVLREGGTFAAKVFDGDMVAELTEELQPWFRVVRRTKPPASRSGSSEMYVVGLGFHLPVEPPTVAEGPG
ncbi:MAG: RlmE family RNA methyltransferase [Thermoplasmata archaeon]|nr:RlmE family RNA methyltransferase [Thermoplasmata archaeon]